MKEQFLIRFWGVRGSCPTIEPNTLKYGGNTPCVQLQIGETLIILDAGTGICQLGKMLSNKEENINAHIFITHTHWDHIQGLPYFLPGYKEGNNFKMYGERKNNLSFSEVIKGLMKYPYFPVTWDEMKADFTFYELNNKEKIVLKNDIKVKTIPLNHPDGCLGYRIEHKGKSCCYITDIEHEKKINKYLQTFVQDTDILIYDANYTEEEYIGKKGWGHATWESGVILAKETNVKKLLLFHHGNHRSDKEIDEIEKLANKKYPKVLAAMEGMEIIL